MSDAYETDFYAWAMEQAVLLRAGKVGAADSANIAEEIESLGRGEKRELVDRLAILMAHLLSWQYEPGFRSLSLSSSIREQRGTRPIWCGRANTSPSTAACRSWGWRKPHASRPSEREARARASGSAAGNDPHPKAANAMPP